MASDSSDPGTTCPRCGFVWVRSGLRICPRCVLATQFEDDDGDRLITEQDMADADRTHLVPGYVIQERLGRGGCGTVYKATQTALDRTVAIKFLRQDRAVSPQRLERMRRESVSLAQLQHPHILAVIDSGEVAGEHYIVMEYAPGGDLRGLMRTGPVPVDDVVRLVKEAASALSQAHEEGMVHRDIKPENLLLDRDGRVRVADFGLAASSSEMARLTQSGSPLGTPGYMAPEQQGKGEPEHTDHRADIFSLGCLGYELLTGLLPTGNPALPSATAGVPKSADAPILKAMASAPAERYESANAFATDLESALGKSARPGKRGWKVAAMLACMALLAWFVASKVMEPSAPTKESGKIADQQRLETFLNGYLETASLGGDIAKMETFMKFPIGRYYNEEEMTLEAFRKHRSDIAKRWPERSYTYVESPSIVQATNLEGGGCVYEIAAKVAYTVRSPEAQSEGLQPVTYEVIERADGVLMIDKVSEAKPPEAKKLYTSLETIERERLSVLERLRSAPRPLAESLREARQVLVKSYDRGFESTEIVADEIPGWSEQGALQFVLRFLQSKDPGGEPVWFDDVVNYLGKGLVPGSEVREILKNDYSAWPERWQYLQKTPTVKKTSDGMYEVSVQYVHFALSPRLMRKWHLDRRYGVKKGRNGQPVIASYQEDARETGSLTESERQFLIMHFCKNYYAAGCADSDLSQLNFLHDPVYYIDRDKSLLELNKDFERYHSIRPNRKLNMLVAPELAALGDENYLVACQFAVSRGEGDEPVTLTDLMQIRFFGNEPHVVFVKPQA